MSLYARYVLPRLIDLVMRNKADTAERAKLIPQASGVVLEIGIGSGLNIPYYGSTVKRLYGVDPSRELWKIGRRRVRDARFPVEFIAGSAERIPLDDAAADTVVTTWTLCTIPDAGRALSEIRRVLKPGGRLIFIEHGQAPDPGVEAWQRRLNPIWRPVAGGCNLNRKIDDLIVSAGFQMMRIDRGYGDGPRPMSYLYKGVAERGSTRPSPQVKLPAPFPPHLPNSLGGNPMKRVLTLNLVTLSLAASVYAGEFDTAEGQRLRVSDEMQAPAVQAANPTRTVREATGSSERRALKFVVEWHQAIDYFAMYVDKVGQGAPAP